MYTEQMTQALSIAGVDNIATLNSGGTATSLSGAVNMGLFRRAMAIVYVGTVTGGGSLTARFQSSATSGGSYADIAGTTTNAITASNKYQTLEIRADQMPAGQPWLKVLLTEGGGQNVVCGAVLIGGEAAQKPGNANDVASTTLTQRLVA